MQVEKCHLTNVWATYLIVAHLQSKIQTYVQGRYGRHSARTTDDHRQCI